FGFITVLDRLRGLIHNLAARYGLQSLYGSFRAIDIPVLDLAHHAGALVSALAREAGAAVKQDEVGAIVLGCTGFLGCAEGMRRHLVEVGCDVPVIDPIPLAVHVADSLVKTSLSHSKWLYPAPGRKRLKGYSFDEFSSA